MPRPSCTEVNLGVVLVLVLRQCCKGLLLFVRVKLEELS